MSSSTTADHQPGGEDNVSEQRPLPAQIKHPASCKRLPTTRTASSIPKRTQRPNQQPDTATASASAGLATHQSLSSVPQSFASSSSSSPSSAIQPGQFRTYTSSSPLITASSNSNNSNNSNNRNSSNSNNPLSPKSGGRLTRTAHNSNVYFSDSEDSQSHRSAAAPVTQPLRLVATAASRSQQQHHRRHRQFHRTLAPSELSADHQSPASGSVAPKSVQSTDDTEDEDADGGRPASPAAAHPGNVGALSAASRLRQSPARLRRSSGSSSPTKRGRRLPVVAGGGDDDIGEAAEERSSASGRGVSAAAAGAAGNGAAGAAGHEKRSMLLSYGPESICVLAFILTTFATFQNAPPKLSRIAAAPAFFPAGSLVHDFPTGHLDTVQTRVKSADISLVLFYAPWSADCQAARLSYEQTARLFYRSTYFSAVNCWQPGGDCRAQYTKIVEWPVTMAYYQTGHAVLYTGRRHTASLVRFVRSLQRPLQRVHDNDAMLRLMHSHDAVVVAFLGAGALRPGSADSRRYATLYAEAIKWLEHDPYQAVAFAVVTGTATQSFGIVQQSALRVYRWNGTVEHEFPANWSQTRMHTWLLAETAPATRATQWLQPPGTKASTLAPLVAAGPLLLLFTPRNGIAAPSTGANDGYDMLRQVALAYGNCGGGDAAGNRQWLAEMSRVYMTHVRALAAAEQAAFREDCARQRRAAELAARAEARCWSEGIEAGASCERKQQQQQQQPQRFASVVFGNVVNSSKLPSGGIRDSLLAAGCCGQCRIGPRNVGDLDMCDDSCQPSVGAGGALASSCGAPTAAAERVWRTSMLDSSADERSAANLQQLTSQSMCELQFASQQLPDYPQVQFFGLADEAGEYFERIAEQGCAGNRTLRFVALDSAVYGVYAERLGVQLQAQADRTAAVIVDHEMESTFIHDGPLSTPSLIDFVHNFTVRRLQRHLKVESNRLRSPLARHPRVELPVPEPDQESAAAANTDAPQPGDPQPQTPRAAAPPAPLYSPWPADTAVELRQLDARSFVANVAHSNRTVFVLYHSLQCALCTPMSHSLLMVGQLLAELRSQLELVRIDADRNDLPWQYTVDRVPALIAYPAGDRHVESRIYPSGRAATVPNVLAFVLANVERPVRLHAMVLVCVASRTKSGHLSADCARTVRTEIRSAIAFSLRQWRTLRHLRGRIVRRLQALQRLLLQTLRPTTDHRAAGADRLLQLVQAVRQVWPTSPLLPA